MGTRLVWYTRPFYELQTAILDVYHTFNYGVNNSVIRRSSLSNSM